MKNPRAPADKVQTEAEYLIFTDDTSKRYEDFLGSDLSHVDETLGIKYTDNDIHADTLLLLRYNCPDTSCDVACLGWPHLHHHVRSVHHKTMCDLCTRNKKVFTHEHELFTQPALKKHEKVGDDTPGTANQSGFKGHPECGFCKRRFYGDDELYTHCRDRHERCHICDRRRQGGQQQYFVDYDSLEQHFKDKHFLCADQECLDKKFIVFESEMDLKGHQLEMHPNGLTKDARRDARRVDISTFDYRAPHQEPRRGRGERDGRGRGRDPTTEPLPASTAQPLRRDELAYQRQLAICTAQAAPTRSAGGQLMPAQVESSRSRPSSSQTSPAPAFASLSINDDSHSSEAQTPQQRARMIAHTALISRASALLGNDAAKLSTFKISVSSYQQSTLTARALITTFFSIFDAPASDLGKLINELADLYESDEKKEGLRKAWSDWRAINEDYPSLPALGPSTTAASIAGAGVTTGGGHRVLKLKNSTAPSLSGSTGTPKAAPRSWGSNAAVGAAPSPAISNTGSIAKVGTTTPWASGSGTSPAPSRPASTKPAPQGAEAFPALPTARKPNTLIAGLTRGAVRWDSGGVGSNAWGATNGYLPSGDDNSGAVDDSETAAAANGNAGKKKGKQGRKGEVLYKFG